MENLQIDENNEEGSINKDVTDSVDSLDQKKNSSGINFALGSPESVDIKDISDRISLDVEHNDEINNANIDTTSLKSVNSNLNEVPFKGDNVSNEDISKVETESDIEADWLSTNFEDVTDRETILSYISRLQKFVRKQNKKISKLKSKLKHYVSIIFLTT